MKPIVEIICVTYGHGFKLKCFIDSIRCQTSKNWALHIIHDGPEGFDALKLNLTTNGYLDRENIVLTATDKRYNDYGHSLREFGLQNRISDAKYITITNGDNYYAPVWVRQLELSPSGSDFIYWDCVHDHDRNANFDRRGGYALLDTKLKNCAIDMGCAAIRSDIAVEVGFPYRNFCGDWDYFKNCLSKCDPKKVFKNQRILFVHN